MFISLGKHLQTCFYYYKHNFIPQISQDSVSLVLREEQQYGPHKKLILPGQNLEKNDIENKNKRLIFNLSS